MAQIREGCDRKENVFSTTQGVILVGGLIGLLAVVLQYFGNPGNMGVCVACFERDIAGALGLHMAKVVQYLRPEIMGLGLGAFAMASYSREYAVRGGSAPVVRFFLGMVAAIGALIFLGCPWRAMLRLAGGDLNAVVGLAGLATGIFLGTLFLRKGYSLGRATPQSRMLGALYPCVLIILLAARIVYPPLAGQEQNGMIWYSLKGPGAQHAPLLLSLFVGLVIGGLAQRSRFCTMGAFRDVFLFRHFHLFAGIVSLVVVAFGANMMFGQFTLGWEGQPVAHTDGVWNFLGMALAGLAFALAGGCPGRQLFAAGEGNTDAACFSLGMLAGAAVAHTYATASSPAGVAANGPVAVALGFAFCGAIGFFYSKRTTR